MFDRQTYIASLNLYLKASELACNIFPLQHQVIACNRKLNALIGSDKAADLQETSDLRDEIFGCELEIACIQVCISRIIRQVDAMRLPEGYALVGSRHKAVATLA